MTSLPLPGLVFCERCGSPVDERSGHSPQHCVACELFVCASCWDAGIRRCSACSESAALSPGPQGNLARAQLHLAAIQGAGAALDRMADAPRDEVRRSIEQPQLVMIRAAAHRAEAEALLAPVRGKSRAEADRLLEQLSDETARLRSRLDDQLLHVMANDHASAAAEEVSRDDLVPVARRRGPLVAVASLGLAAAVVVAAVLITRPSIPAAGLAPGGSSASRTELATSTPEGGVLGETGTPLPTAQPAPSGAIAAGRSLTFDEQRMNAPLDSAWQVRRGEPEQVELVALPSAVDRSIRLAVSDAGDGVEICRAVAADVAELSITVRMDGETPELGVRLTPDGATPAGVQLAPGVAAPGSEIVPEAAAWYVLTVGIPSEGGTTTWELAD